MKAESYRWGVYDALIKGETHIAPIWQDHVAEGLCSCEPVIRVGRDNCGKSPYFYIIHKEFKDANRT